MRKGTLLLLLFLAAGLVSAQSGQSRLNTLFDAADRYYEEEQYEAAAEALEEAEALASTDSEKAAYYWRKSRSVLNLADEAEKAGADEEQLLQQYELGESLAQKAIELDPEDYNGYYWRSANVGRWGQTKGILNSLMKAGPMRDDLEIAVRKNAKHADSYYVLGMLYASVPKLISFGNEEWAVSYSRRALDVYNGDKTKYSYYLKLGEHLKAREWSARKRQREAGKIEDEYSEKSDPVEKYRYFETAFDFSASQPYSPSGVEELSDTEEAIAIMEWIVRELSGVSNPTSSESENLEDARLYLEEWK